MENTKSVVFSENGYGLGRRIGESLPESTLGLPPQPKIKSVATDAENGLSLGTSLKLYGQMCQDTSKLTGIVDMVPTLLPRYQISL